ncbi:asparagine synthase (glutamine-hydrolyzing) [Planctomicrobium sp. SH664]|uniref:asparagine synthase (glutamine-hydrolyzing) n=1 Tax=Planctomicrobium sp. SH664 TaxID=3448125 RepID=UPI003F5BBF96
MCGITGAVWSSPATAISRGTLGQMVEAIRHRGPDDDGFLYSPEEPARHERATQVALGHRRLSIIDLDSGRQPISNEDGTISVIFNGEIYNYVELREELRRRGHHFATSTDTEVIVHLYEEEGPHCVQKMRGMFTFALWDARRERLLLARDRLGEKPLYYRHDSRRLIFGSELKSLLQVPGVPRQVDPEAIDLFLTYQYVPHPRSIFKGFHKLPPAHVAVYENDRLTVERYWKPPFQPDEQTPHDESLSPDQWRRQLRETLTESVRIRMRSDVPVGAFLSGGVDSTIIAGLMQSLSPRPIHTFSIGFPVPEFDERRYARLAAQHLRTDHHEFVVEPSALETLPQLIWHYDEPFSDSSAIPMMYLAKVTKPLVTVALSGDGGDELFAGYTRYQAVDLASRTDRLPAPLKSLLGWSGWQQIPTSTKQRSFGRRAKRFIAQLGQSPERRYLRWIGIFDEESRQRLYSPSFREAVRGFDSARFILDAYQECPDRDIVTRTTCVDMLTYLPCDIMTKVDIATMTYAVESRSPFLDHPVAELAARMPIELKCRGGRGKQVLMETFSDLLPQEIQHRSKMGFGVPIDHWFRNELTGLLRGTLLSDRALDRGIFQRERVEQLIQEHVSKKWDHAYRLWALLCLESWHRIFVDQPPPLVPPATLGHD